MAVSMARVELPTPPALGMNEITTGEFAVDVVSGGSADPRDNVEDFLRQSGLGDPVCVSGLDEPLIVSRGNVAANNDEEHVSRIAPDNVDQIVDVRCPEAALAPEG